MAAPSGFKEFTNALQRKITSSTNVDEIVTLGTLKSILVLNPDYTSFYNDYYKDLSGNYNTLADKGNGESLVKEILSYDAVAAAVGPVTDPKGIKTDISFSFTDNKGNGFNMIFNNDPPDNAFQNFTNAAQAFYESSFSATCRYIHLTRPDLSGNLNLTEVQTALNNNSQISKTLDVIYCSGASSLGNMFGKNDFRDFKNVNFQLNYKGGSCVSEIKTKIINRPADSKYCVVFLQGISQLQEKEFTDLVTVLDGKYAKIIIYDSKLGTITKRENITITSSFLTSVNENVEYIVINKGDLGSGGNDKNFGMFRGSTFKKYKFKCLEDEVTGTKNKVITIDENLSNNEIKEILEYYLFSSIIVDIREPQA